MDWVQFAIQIDDNNDDLPSYTSPPSHPPQMREKSLICGRWEGQDASPLSPTANEEKIPHLWWVRGANSPLAPCPFHPPQMRDPPLMSGGPSCAVGSHRFPHSYKLTCPPSAPLHTHVYSCGNRNGPNYTRLARLGWIHGHHTL